MNVHEIYGGKFVGRLSDLTNDMLEAKILQYTPFDPARARLIVRAGVRWFEPMGDEGMLDVTTLDLTRDLRTALGELGATFASCVLEIDDGHVLRVLATSVFPHWSSFERISLPVVDALIEFLTN